MARRPHAYAGASGSLTIDRVRILGRRFVVQPKLDGAYVRVALDSRGRVGWLFTRSGREVPDHVAGPLLGARIGSPHAELAGEIEWHTEAGTRAFEAQGYRRIHLFDCTHDGARSLAAEPYSNRRDALYRMQSVVVGARSSWYRDRVGKAHDARSGDYVRAVPEGWRLFPIVPQYAPQEADALWDRATSADSDLEGIVVVALDAPLGRRGSKRKCKPISTLDAVVVQVCPRVASVTWGGQSFTVACTARDRLQPGQIVEVAHEGWYAPKGSGRCGQGLSAAVPRFARLVRRRPDLGG